MRQRLSVMQQICLPVSLAASLGASCRPAPPSHPHSPPPVIRHHSASRCLIADTPQSSPVAQHSFLPYPYPPPISSPSSSPLPLPYTHPHTGTRCLLSSALSHSRPLPSSSAGAAATALLLRCLATGATARLLHRPAAHPPAPPSSSSPPTVSSALIAGPGLLEALPLTRRDGELVRRGGAALGWSWQCGGRGSEEREREREREGEGEGEGEGAVGDSSPAPPSLAEGPAASLARSAWT